MRQSNWLELMNAEFEAAQDRPFEYAVHDCAMFAARVRDAIEVGSAMVTTLLGMYSDEATAEALLATPGGLMAVTTGVLGVPKAAGLAMRGDVVLLGTGASETLAICAGPQLVAVAEVGITPRSLGLARCAWS